LRRKALRSEAGSAGPRPRPEDTRRALAEEKGSRFDVEVLKIKAPR
jgi:hypothetical protein